MPPAKPEAKRKKAHSDDEVRTVAVASARIADAGRGIDITVLHVEKAILVTDYFVIVSARNKRQIQAIAGDIRDYLRDEGFRHVRYEGYEEAAWVLVDAGPIIVHIFRQDLRSYYDLELLWGDAPLVEWRENDGRETERS
ncbi:MAG: ribosome silencing factor [Planctomycetes bacterium]|nr:ribosome silencing factor [Planctomycetota bacterium]